MYSVESCGKPARTLPQDILSIMLLLGLLLLLGWSFIAEKWLTTKPSNAIRMETYQYDHPIGPVEPLTTKKVLHITTTGYSNWEHCHICTDYRHGLTASGLIARRGVCAVDPHVIPRWTILFIPGYGPCWAVDTGSAVRGRIVDLYFDSQQEAISWGVQKVQAKVLGWEKP